ncbi:MAG: T9SS type A sorting domain-containing protein, partial [Bacteroidota bacterium]
PGPGTHYFTNGNTNYVYMVKLDSTGTFVWMKGLSGGYSQCNKMGFDANGNILIGGKFFDTVDFRPGPGTFNMTESNGWGHSYLASYDPNGGLRWARKFAYGNQVWVHGIAGDSNGDVYCMGYFYFSQGSMNFHPNGGSAPVAGITKPIFVLKVDSAGIFQWVKSLESPLGTALPSQIRITPDRRIHIFGSYSGNLDCDPGPGTVMLNSLDQLDPFMTVLDHNGNYVRSFTFGGPAHQYGNGMAIDADGSYYCTGFMQDSTDFDPSPNTTLLTPAGTDDAWIAKYDSLGNLVWTYGLGSNAMAVSTFDSERGSRMHVDRDGNIYIAGAIADTVDYDPGPGIDPHICSNMLDAFLTRLGTEVVPCQPSSSLETIAACDSFFWQGQFLHASGTYYDTIPNTQGCDSSLTLALTITQLDDSVLLNGPQLTAVQTGASYQWIDCATGNAIPNATGQSFQPTVSGSYAVVLQLNGCADTSACHPVTVVGVEKSLGLGVQIAPNPSDGLFQVTLEGFVDGVELSVFDAFGKVVWRREVTSEVELVDLSGVASGVYYLAVIGDSGVLRRRILKF